MEIVFFTGYDNYKKDICLKLYQPVEIYGYFLYKRNAKVFENNKFEKFWLQVYSNAYTYKYLNTSEDDIQENIVSFAKEISQKETISINQFRDFIDQSDLIIDSRWNGENKRPRNIIDRKSVV